MTVRSSPFPRGPVSLCATIALVLAAAACGQTATPSDGLDVGQVGDVPGADLGAPDVPVDTATSDSAQLDTVAQDVPDASSDGGDDAVDVVHCTTSTDCPSPTEACRVAACQNGQCAVASALDATPCDDQDACTTGEACQAGACLPGAKKDCSDGNLCTTDTCTGGLCSHVDNTLPCTDNDVCTVGDGCAGGACLSGAATACDDNNACTQDACDAATGCAHAGKNGATCSDGNECTVGDACQGADCVALAVATCTDDNPCTDDGCDPASGCALLPNSVTCSDNDACTGGDACAGSACVSGSAVNCDDLNPCTVDACESASGCTHSADANATCTDNNACSIGDACQMGVCVPGAVTPCDDGNPCTLDDCSVETGCANLALPAPCNDANACTVGDVCQGGTCGFTLQLACNDGNPCTDDSCEPQSGCVFVNNALPCSDYNNCTTGDTCSAGVCKPAAPSACDDGNPCTTETCDPATGCSKANNNAPCSDGSVCTVSDVCAGGTCQAGAALACSDGNPCTLDSCNAANGCVFPNQAGSCSDGSLCTYQDVCGGGVCLPGAQTNCDDANGCTTDACHPKTGCAHGANALACSDGSLCTGGDACEDGSCIGGAAVVCDDGNPCTTDACVLSQGCTFTDNTEPCSDGSLCTTGDACEGGSCIPGAATVCDDENLCTTDGCNAKSGCTALANTVACEDGSACSIGDHCKNGGCVGGTNLGCDDGNGCTNDSCVAASGCAHSSNEAACSDGNVCTLADMCTDGACSPGAAKVCDDDNPCTTDACDPKLACVTTNNTLPCQDNSVCTQGDVCQDGGCHPGADIVCEEGNPCTDDHCDPALGCLHANNQLPCNDNNGCTLGDTCAAGICTPTTSSPCNDGNPCTTETCDPTTGDCSALDNTAPCNDGDVCTTGDTCAAGDCQPGGALACADGNPCTEDTCVAQSGCVFLPNAATCSDNNVCTEADGCSGGTCVPGAARPCGDGNACTDDSCVPASGCANTTNNAACNDGNACTSSDACAVGLCAGVTLTCDDGNLCTDDSCNPATGCLFAPNSAPCDDGNGCTGADTCTGGSCAATKGCNVHALCTPGAQAISCVCKPFYEGDGFDCADVDECALDNGGCGDPGLFSCTNQVGAPRLCADINECLTANGNCGDPAIFTCTNHIGAAATCTSLIGTCDFAADCPGTDGACRWRTCVNGQCGLGIAVTGTVLDTQTDGDCQRAQCDGAGQVVSVADQGDVPADDGIECTGEVCDSGVPVHPALPATTGCGENGGSECDGKGKCVQCIANNECGIDTVCAQHVCLAGACTVTAAPFGTPVGVQVKGDCQVTVCDGSGAVTATGDDSDIPAQDGNQCTGEMCMGGVAVHPPLDVTAACSQSDGSHCDGTGYCVQCTTASECGVDSVCQVWNCTSGICGVQNAPQATLVGEQVVGDCQQVQCNGFGAIVSVEVAGDTPADDANVCTAEVCVSGVPSHPAEADGTTCSGGSCQSGACVATVVESLAVLRVGDGSGTLSSAAARVFIDGYKLDGTPLGSLALPTALSGANHPLTLAGSATSEGGLARSADGHYLVLAGYDAAPATAAVNGTASSVVPRVIGRIDAAAKIDTSTGLTSAFSTVSVRGATSVNGSGFWVSGAGSATTGGVWYIGTGTIGTGTQVLSSPANARWMQIFDGQAFVSATSTTVAQVGTDLPKTAASAVALTGLPISGGSPYGFALLDRDDAVPGLDTLYFADDRSAGSGGGVQRWTLSQGTWGISKTFISGLSTGCRGLTAWVTGANVTIAATTTDNKLVLLVDDGSANPAFATLATAATNTAMRGVALMAK